jgi:hypothetical protein
MFEEESSIRIDSGWDITNEKLEEYQSINRNFLVRKELYNVLYSINGQPVCISNFRFLDNRNLIIQDYSYGETNMIGPMLKEILMRTRKKFPDVNMYIVIDESGNGKPYEALRKDNIVSILKDTYYSVGFARNPLFSADEPIEIFMDTRFHKLWPFDGNIKDTMESFIEVQREKIEYEFARRHVVENTTQEESPLLTPQLQPIQPSSLPEPSLVADEKESPRIKKKSRKEVAVEDILWLPQKRVGNSRRGVVQQDKNAKDKNFIAQPKRKRGRPGSR